MSDRRITCADRCCVSFVSGLHVSARYRMVLLTVMLFTSLLAGAGTTVSAGVPGKWLLDEGRLHGLLVDEPNAVDAEYMLIWMRAATEVSPDLCDAYLWQGDLLNRLGRTEQSLASLKKYSACDRQDLPAILNLIEVEASDLQTAEERVSYYQMKLDGNQPEEVASDLHRRLAEIFWEQGDAKAAGEHVQKAISLCPLNYRARELATEIEGKLDDPVSRLSLVLQKVSLNPSSVESLWAVGGLLDQLSMPAEAATWYGYALALHEQQWGATNQPIDLMADLSRTVLAAGQYEKASAMCDRILKDHPLAVVPVFLKVYAARQLGKDKDVSETVDKLDEKFREIVDAGLAKEDALLCTQIAWFHIWSKPDRARALEFALTALKLMPNDPQVQTTAGWAYLINGHLDEAVDLLQPLVESDQWAALGVAQALLAKKNKTASLESLRKGEKQRYCGVAYEKIVRALGRMGEKPSAKPDRTAITRVLSGFDGRVLEFPHKIGELLSFEVTAVQDAVSFDQQIDVVFSLTNKAPYPVTLGEQGMVDPEVFVSVKDNTLHGADYPFYHSVSLAKQYVLAPGEKVSVQECVDVGAARIITSQQPQRRIELEFSFVVCPSNIADPSSSSMLGDAGAVVARVVRLPVDASQKGLERLWQQLRSPSESDRLCGVGELVALIDERNRSMVEDAKYPAATVDVEVLANRLSQTLYDQSAVVRARSVWGMSHVPTMIENVDAVAPFLSDPSWLVRLVAMDLLANSQGKAFVPVLKRMEHDENVLVSQLATLHRTYLEQGGDRGR